VVTDGVIDGIVGPGVAELVVIAVDVAAGAKGVTRPLPASSVYGGSQNPDIPGTHPVQCGLSVYN